MTYTCPMHPEIEQNQPGTCPKCGMKLVLKGGKASKEHTLQEESYKPLAIIIGLIALVTAVLAHRDIVAGVFNWERTMSVFMAGFFLVFSGFKLLDVAGFAEGYSTYDLLARKVWVYGYIYPFIELVLGLAYAASWHLPTINIITFVVMGFSALGVIESLLHKRKFRCACLGTIIKVPLTSVTLIEDFGMAAMALIMWLAR